MIQPDVDQIKVAGLIPSWHHVDCFLENLEELDAESVAPDELSGFAKLKADGKQEVKDKFEAKVGAVKR